jgi:predicted MFS family arabinose efflux permease
MASAGHLGITSARTLGAAGLAVVLLAILPFVESRSSHPLFPASLLKCPNFFAANTAALLIHAVVTGLVVSLNLFMQELLHYSPINSGLLYLTFPAAFIAGGWLVERSMASISLRIGIFVGSMVLILATLLLVFVPLEGRSPLALVGIMITAGVGGAVGQILLMALSTRAVPRERQGVATGVLISFQQVGLALGASMSVMAITLRPLQETAASAFTRAFLTCGMVAVAGLAVAMLFTRPSVSA